MLILTLDTTSDWGGAAIYREGECLASSRQQGFTEYSVSLFYAADECLKQAGLRLDQINLYAAANGPGSFTGIRAGLAAVQGWAKAFGKPAHGVSVLEAMAEMASAPTGFALSILDARRGEFYARLFRRLAPGDGAAPWSARRFEPEGDGVILKPREMMPFIESHDREKAGGSITVRENDPQAGALAEAISALPAEWRWETVPGFLFPAIARLAAAAAQEGPLPAQDLSACYIRRPDAELNWKE